MTLSRDARINLAAGLLLAVAAAWLVHRTEWAEVDVRDPPSGEAARDPHYALKQIARRAAATVESPQNLDRLPPPHAVLVLASTDWDLFPERDRALRTWITAGGDLVLQGKGRRPAWIDLDLHRVPRPARDADDSGREMRSRPTGKALPACHEVRERNDLPPAFGDRRAFTLCGWNFGMALGTGAPVQWALDGPGGAEALRIRMGRGSVTALLDDVTVNERILDGDNALVAAAALQLAPGRDVWFVEAERRTPLLALVWRTGAPAVLLSALALALLLWRAGRRFGPRAAPADLARRSVAEQIRGTTAFIFRRDGATLLRAQLRALEQAGRRRIPDHDRLDRRSRARAIAALSGLDVDALQRAMDPALHRRPRELAAALQLIETAVRRLRLNP